jgi:hypothetical protein
MSTAAAAASDAGSGQTDQKLSTAVTATAASLNAPAKALPQQEAYDMRHDVKAGPPLVALVEGMSFFSVTD